MSDKIWFDPTSDKWVLSDGGHHLEVPHWARKIIVNEFERETRPLRNENAKLRELVRDYERCTMHVDCSMCEYDGKLSTHCPLSPCFPDADELRELEIEVDG